MHGLEKKIRRILSVPEDFVWKTQKLKLADDILAPHRKKLGKSLKPEEQQSVLDFYENDIPKK